MKLDGYREFISAVAQWASEDQYASAYIAARQAYESKVGKFYQEDSDYEAKITNFIEWYLMDRELPDYGIPPIELYQIKQADSGALTQHDLVQSCNHSVHSLFQIKSIHPLGVIDVLKQNQKHSLENDAIGLEKGLIVDGRIVNIEDKNYFTDSLMVYASEARPYILQEAELFARSAEAGSESAKQEFLQDLMYMKWRKARFPQLKNEIVFSRVGVLQARKEAGKQSKPNAS